MDTRASGTGRSGRPLPVRRLFPWLSGLILVVGVTYAIVAFVPRHHPAASPAPSNPPAKTPAKPRTVPLSKAATAVARTFLRTAVARTDLAAAWDISDANVRGGLTRAEWMTGQIPVVPYPIKSLAVARFKVDYSYPDAALIEVALLPTSGATIKPQTFFLGLKRIAGPGGKTHWAADNWVPRATTLVPRPSN